MLRSQCRRCRQQYNQASCQPTGKPLRARVGRLRAGGQGRSNHRGDYGETSMLMPGGDYRLELRQLCWTLGFWCGSSTHHISSSSSCSSSCYLCN